MLVRLKNLCLELIFPVHCVGCRAEGAWLCASCREKIQLRETQHCPACWCVSALGRTCDRCVKNSELAGLKIAASYEKNPALAAAVKTLKYKFSEPLAETLGDLLAVTVTEKDFPPDILLTFVPLHKTRERWRGFNQAELLARAIGKKFHWPVTPLLTRVKNTPQQAKLGRAERLKNLTAAFELAKNVDVKNKTIILVDDVASTGTTLEECAKVLRNNGATEVWGCVVARG